MASTLAPTGGRVCLLVAAATAVVVATTPVNLLLLWLCRPLAGQTAGRDLSGGPVLLGGVVNAGLLLALCGLALLVSHRASVGWQRGAIVVALVFYLGLWVCGSLALVAVLVATDAA